MTEIGDIICHINGKDEILPHGISLLDFLQMKNIPVGAVVIEHNRKVLPKGQYDGIIFADGDILEIVQIIGGG